MLIRQLAIKDFLKKLCDNDRKGMYSWKKRSTMFLPLKH